MFKIGDKVNYKGKENGIIKSLSEYGAYVVFSCGNDWDNYQNYTAALCGKNDLTLGWI
jgi:hypothetical protein